MSVNDSFSREDCIREYTNHMNSNVQPTTLLFIEKKKLANNIINILNKKLLLSFFI